MIDAKDYQYQHGFSAMHSKAMYDAGKREQKAKKSLAVIDDFVNEAGYRPRDLSLPDIGYSTGFPTHLYRQYSGRAPGGTS